MSGDVLQSYILGHNFTKTQISSTVRPPADGEEADLLSIGGRSSQSSISEVSEVSSATPRYIHNLFCFLDFNCPNFCVTLLV